MKKKKWLKIALIAISILIGLSVIGIVIFGCAVGKQVGEGLLHQNDGNDTKSNSINQLAKWNYDTEAFLTKYKETPISFVASDNNVVPAVLLEGDTSSDQIAILVHGAGGDHVCMYPVAEPYLENGYRVIAIDQRGSGDSKDPHVSFGYYESRDVMAAVDYAHEIGATKVIVEGQSMGALTCAVYSATEHANQNVDAFIFDSMILSMDYMFRGVWPDLGGADDGSVDFAIFFGDIYLKNHYGFGFNDVDASIALKKNTVPSLMLYASEDELVPASQADQMFQAIAATNKKRVDFPCGHVKCIIDYKQDCTNAIMDFLSTIQ